MALAELRGKMTRESWELASWIATTIGSALTVIGLIVVIVQLWLQRKQARLAALDVLFSEIDTHQARLARDYIYKVDSDKLRYTYLHDEPANADQRKNVEDTLATLERLAYKILTNQVPSEDAFNLYGGVILSIAAKTWPYIKDQREMRKGNPTAHRLEYRRYFENLVKKWIPKYCSELNIKLPPQDLKDTEVLLKHVFQPKAPPST